MLAPDDDPAGSEHAWIEPRVARTLTGRPLGVAEVFRWNLGQLQGMCFTRRALDATGPLDPSFEILDDLDLVLRVAVRFQAVFLDEPAFAYRRHPAGVARNRDKVRAEAIRLGDKLAREHRMRSPASVARRSCAARRVAGRVSPRTVSARATPQGRAPRWARRGRSRRTT
jgi:hypothetical protein